MKVIYETNLPKKISSFSMMREKVFDDTRRSAASSGGFFLMEKVRQHIESEGGGKWPKGHPLTTAFENKNDMWSKRSRTHRPYFGLGKFARYKMTRGSHRVEIGFGTFSSKSIENPSFSRVLQDVAHKAQVGDSVVATSKMQRKVAVLKDKIGPPYHIGKTITLPIRTIMGPVFIENQRAFFVLFSNRYEKALLKRFERL